MEIGSSSICVLAVVNSCASPNLTHDEGDYYMVGGKMSRAFGRPTGETVLPHLWLLAREVAQTFLRISQRIHAPGGVAAEAGSNLVLIGQAGHRAKGYHYIGISAGHNR